MRLPGVALVVTATGFVSACGLGIVGVASGPPDGGADASLPDGSVDGTTGDENGTVVPLDASATPLVYLSATITFWTFDPVKQAFKNFGDMPSSCQNAKTYLDEIAVDGAGKVYGDSRDAIAFYSVDPVRYECTKLGAPGAVPYALTFVPRGGGFALVGFKDSSYYDVDVATGAATQIPGPGLGVHAVSGDAVYGGGKLYVSVKGGGDCTNTDCLYEADPSTGSTIGLPVAIFPAKEIWGLGYGAGKVYGFAHDGSVWEVTPGTPATIRSIPNPGVQGWFGAGSSPLSR